jgi:cytochrome c biogenesis protein CcmG/thiol:disulfide interchange protein DsbE
MNRTVLIVGLLIVAPLLIFLALSFGKDPRALDSPLVGKAAPNFSLQTLDGETVELDDYRGKPIFLNFWATWCQPCIVEHPILQAGARQFDGRVQFLGVVYHDETAKIRAFINSRGEWGPTLLDTDGSVAVSYGVYGAPETFLIDENGIIVEKHVGPFSPDLLFRKLNEIL